MWRRAGIIISCGLISPTASAGLDRRGFRCSRGPLSPHVIDHETAHDGAERQAVGMRPAICSLRHLDFEHEGKSARSARTDQPPLAFRLAEFGDEGNGGSVS